MHVRICGPVCTYMWPCVCMRICILVCICEHVFFVHIYLSLFPSVAIQYLVIAKSSPDPRGRTPETQPPNAFKQTGVQALSLNTSLTPWADTASEYYKYMYIYMYMDVWCVYTYLYQRFVTTLRPSSGRLRFSCQTRSKHLRARAADAASIAHRMGPRV